MTVGERIKQRRIELGLSQSELAKKMGYSGKSSVCKAETSDDNITTTKVAKFAKALECSESYLMGWENADDIIKSAAYDAVVWDYYRKLTDLNKEKVKDFVVFLYSQQAD